MTSISLNIKRLQHLLDLYSLSKEDFLFLLNKSRKRPLVEKDIFKSEIKIDLLKKIDKVFNKGLNYYINPEDPFKSADESIFFRKHQFNADLNFASKKIINQFEEQKISISSISKLSDFSLDRLLPFYSANDNPHEIAIEVSNSLYPKFHRNLKEFLKALISKLADQNILVFEFVETWNKKERANVEGIYLAPNVIVLKRLQKAFRREIFTLAHELGHYLINEEEVDEKISEYAIDYFSLNKIEKWCNDFAFFFLAQQYYEIIVKLEIASEKNDYHHDILESISERTNLSLIALYTRLLINNKISQKNYKVIKEDLYQKYLEKEDDEKQRKELEKATGKETKGSTPKPIQSPLLIKTMQFAFLEGIINEVELCRRLNLKPNKLELFLQ
ncbi:MAG TPA: ImmA/IrrE family metallo-endopeptidase [Candidatus Nanoarchaeia archaeon]|nr:ImmA/IrrE family metallo-endopeptidase [Candidatus Nanoarchaeia archaeon]